MTAPAVGTREEWLAARVELLEQEKEHTRRADELARKRQELPWVKVDKEYVFQTEDGEKTLAELFDGRSQLIVYHFMHGPNTPEGCPGCTFHTDTLDGAHTHLAAHDVTFVLVSRSPLPTLLEYRERMGWQLPWVSAEGTGFNEDFSDFGGLGYNFGSPGGANVDVFEDMELMALSCFALDDGDVYHTYSAYDRGTDALNATWQLLDRAPKGRDDGVDRDWPKRRDEY